MRRTAFSLTFPRYRKRLPTHLSHYFPAFAEALPSFLQRNRISSQYMRRFCVHIHSNNLFFCLKRPLYYMKNQTTLHVLPCFYHLSEQKLVWGVLLSQAPDITAPKLYSLHKGTLILLFWHSFLWVPFWLFIVPGHKVFFQFYHNNYMISSALCWICLKSLLNKRIVNTIFTMIFYNYIQAAQ